jgi:hypothetical protein
MQPDVKIALTIHPEISHEIMEKTFEGGLLAHLLVPLRTATGYQLCAPHGVSPVFELGRLHEAALASKGELAARMEPIIREALIRNETLYNPSLGLDEVSAGLGIDFDITTVLQEICRLHTNRHPYFQVLWSTFVEGHERRLAQHGTISGGADLVTATGVVSLNAKDWLDQQTKAALEVQAIVRQGGDWTFTGTTEADGTYHVGLAPTDIRKVLANDPLDELHIKRDVNGEYDLYLWKAPEGVSLWLEVRSTLEGAMASGESYLDRAEEECSEKLCMSMGLSFKEWSIEWDDGLPHAINRREPDLHIVYEGDGTWALLMNEDERGVSAKPSVLADMVREVHRGLE